MDSLTPRQTLPQVQIDPDNPFPVTDIYAEPEVAAGPRFGQLGSGTYGLGGPTPGSGFMFVDPNAPQTGIVGREGAQGAWGIAKSLAGPDASNAEINHIKNQLLELNPELAGKVRAGQSYILPGADTPENIALAKAADQAYLAKRAAQQASLLSDSVLSDFRLPGTMASATVPGLTAMPSSYSATAVNAVDLQLQQERATSAAYWSEVMDGGVNRGGKLGFVQYLGGKIMGSLASFGHSVVEAEVAMFRSPVGTTKGIAKGFANFGPELFNGAVNLVKTSADGYSMIVEKAFMSDGALDGFRQTKAYNMTPVFSYNGSAEQGGAAVFGLLSGPAISKFGKYGVVFDDIGASGPMASQAGAISPRLVTPVERGQGGRFGDLRGVKGDDLEAHHIPQAAMNFTEYKNGGAIVMTADEHMLTRTWGSRGAVTARNEAGMY